MDITCTLATDDLADQRARWLRLITASAVARDETPTGLRLRFRAGAGVARELEQLVAVERRCCAWATWDLEPGRGEVALAIGSTGDGVAALHSMFAEAAL
jgi:hypothetical protein